MNTIVNEKRVHSDPSWDRVYADNVFKQRNSFEHAMYLKYTSFCLPSHRMITTLVRGKVYYKQ